MNVFQKFFGRSATPEQTPALRVADTDRIYAIGDVHGRHDLLCTMMIRLCDDAMSFDDDRQTQFILLGDYIDRGDHSREVIEVLCQFQSRHPGCFQFLRGNHEQALLDFLDDPVGHGDWIEWGGRQTLVSYGLPASSRAPDRAERRDIRDALREKVAPHLRFFETLGRYARSGDVIFAHAALDPAVPLEAQDDSALLWGRLPPDQPSGIGGTRLVHGHFAEWEPVVRPERICIDTGAYYSGRLTAVRLDDGEHFIHVDTADVLE